MRRDANQYLSISAIVCLAAFLILGITANVHIHDPGNSARIQDCSACDLFYGAQQVSFSPAYSTYVGVITAWMISDCGCVISILSPTHESSRAPPSV